MEYNKSSYIQCKINMLLKKYIKYMGYAKEIIFILGYKIMDWIQFYNVNKSDQIKNYVEHFTLKLKNLKNQFIAIIIIKQRWMAEPG